MLYIVYIESARQDAQRRETMTYFGSKTQADEVAAKNNMHADDEVYAVEPAGKYYVVKVYENGEEVFAL